MESQSPFFVPESITFEEAIEVTQSLLFQREEQAIDESELESIISALVKSANGARGFFVTYLTGDAPLADQPSPAVFKGLRSSPETVSELLVKNLAMSTAMQITHDRHRKPELTAGSKRVQQRTLGLLEQLQLTQSRTKLEQLLTSAQTGAGEYGEFLDRWGYDAEQRSAIAQIVQQVRA